MKVSRFLGGSVKFLDIFGFALARESAPVASPSIWPKRYFGVYRSLHDCDMQVKRIVANFWALNPPSARAFYQDVLGLDLLMDHGWIMTYGSGTEMRIEVSFASEGGSGAPVPDLSIEVDDVDEVFEKMNAQGFSAEYGPVDEPWGARRFFVRDPFGKLVNIRSHT